MSHWCPAKKVVFQSAISSLHARASRISPLNISGPVSAATSAFSGFLQPGIQNCMQQKPVLANLGRKTIFARLQSSLQICWESGRTRLRGYMNDTQTSTEVCCHCTTMTRHGDTANVTALSPQKPYDLQSPALLLCPVLI
jgi:hypothetical protein